ncbi:hypothetical protein OGAPHI_006837 [Ogataea philodendri]|uniref:Dihydrodipicolinate synthase n=1 Tax=Ogataea philodendri TaxID=1378263 RepID=A0A9P8T110_9ASCO|nr:uncharacterized protein OGAPHI_006837 [Ogataea philodendri]KAH3661430.1 hypothetical protein OGAPHI_006837 [Ogataea philodendri]
MSELTEGILAPVPCFFDENEEIDYAAFTEHVVRLAVAGVMPVVSGSMGEAIHLERDERIKLIKETRKALDAADLDSIPIMAGAGGLSTKQAIQFATDAAEAGAVSVLVIAPGYYGLGEANLTDYYTKIAAASPIPVLIYNFPAVSGGIDMSSDLILEIASKSPNVVGCKLTCASVAKLGRIAQTPLPPRTTGKPFLALCGFLDFLLPGITVGAGGSITGVANFAPKTCQKLWNMCQQPLTGETLKEINALHLITANADAVASKAGIAGVKGLLHELYGTPANVRSPLLAAPKDAVSELVNNPAIVRVLEVEKSL